MQVRFLSWLLKYKTMSYTEKEKFENVQYRMDAEGFHYCFEGYSHFEEIEDSKFHLLRKKYLEVSKELEDYVNNKCEELRDE